MVATVRCEGIANEKLRQLFADEVVWTFIRLARIIILLVILFGQNDIILTKGAVNVNRAWIRLRSSWAKLEFGCVELVTLAWD